MKNTKAERRKYNGFKQNIVSRYLLGILMISVIVFVLKLFGFPMEVISENLEQKGFSYNEALFNQVSVTFIVISVVTVFSSATQMAYWEDVMQYELVKPKFWNFISISAYLFASLTVGIWLVVMGSDYVYVNTLISIILICILTLKMMAAFFARDYILNDLENRYVLAKQFRHDNDEERYRYQEYKVMLLQTTIQQIEENQYDRVSENIRMLLRNEEYDDVTYLLQQMLLQNKMYLISCIVKTGHFTKRKVWEIFEEICEKALQADAEQNTKHTTSIMKTIVDEVYTTIEKTFHTKSKKISKQPSVLTNPDMDDDLILVTLKYLNFCVENKYFEAYNKAIINFINSSTRTIEKNHLKRDAKDEISIGKKRFAQRGAEFPEAKERLRKNVEGSAELRDLEKNAVEQMKELFRHMEYDWLKE